MMQAVKIKKTKTACSLRTYPQSSTVCLPLLNFYYFLSRIKGLKTFLFIFVFLTWLIRLHVEKMRFILKLYKEFFFQ